MTTLAAATHAESTHRTMTKNALHHIRSEKLFRNVQRSWKTIAALTDTRGYVRSDDFLKAFTCDAYTRDVLERTILLLERTLDDGASVVDFTDIAIAVSVFTDQNALQTTMDIFNLFDLKHENALSQTDLTNWLEIIYTVMQEFSLDFPCTLTPKHLAQRCAKAAFRECHCTHTIEFEPMCRYFGIGPE